MAVPPSSPGYQASRIALAFCCAQLTASALPFCSTTTNGFPVSGERFQQILFGREQIG
jgi:hypothetical protein